MEPAAVLVYNIEPANKNQHLTQVACRRVC